MLNPSSEFTTDTQSTSVNLIPLVFIQKGDTSIYISTSETVLGSNHFLPLLLGIPSLTEKISFESRKYTISSVTLNNLYKKCTNVFIVQISINTCQGSVSKI